MTAPYAAAPRLCSYRISTQPQPNPTPSGQSTAINMCRQGPTSCCYPTDTEAEQAAPYVPVSWLPIIQEPAPHVSIHKTDALRLQLFNATA